MRHTCSREAARASHMRVSVASSKRSMQRWAVVSEATGPKSTSWSRSAPRSVRQSPPSASMTARSRTMRPGSWATALECTRRPETRPEVRPTRSQRPVSRAVPARDVRPSPSQVTSTGMRTVVAFTCTVTFLLGFMAVSQQPLSQPRGSPSSISSTNPGRFVENRG